MTVTRNTISKGAGGLCLKDLATDRLIYLTLNSSMEFTKSVDEGDAPQGVNSSGIAVDLDTPSKEESFELTVNTKKITRGVNELRYGTNHVDKTGYEFPWAESQTVAAGSITLNGDSAPVSGSMFITYLDGAKLTEVGSSPTAGQFVDNGDGTIDFHTDDNGEIMVILYKISANVAVQGGADMSEITYVEAMFYQVTGTSTVANNKGVDILWLPKCGLSGDTSALFSNEVEDNQITLKPVIPDTPSGWTVPFQWIRDYEIDNRNAG